MTKKTKREMFEAIRAVVTDEEMVAFCDKEIAALDKKRAKASEPNPEVVAFRNDVYEFVEAYGVSSISVVAKGLGVTSQKVTPAIKALVEEGRLALVETIKRVNYYNVVKA